MTRPGPLGGAFWRPRSLRAKIVLYAAVPVVTLLGLVIASLATSLYRDLRAASLVRIAAETRSTADRIETWNQQTVTVPLVMAAAQENGMFGDRPASLAYARQILLSYPQLTGAYFGYEPNADGQDAAFLGWATEEQRRAANANGRFIPYWFRDKQDPSTVRLTPLLDMETSFYYQGVKNRMTGAVETAGITLAAELSRHYQPVARPASAADKTMVTEPYLYEGKLLLEQTYPIMIGGRFVGVAGVDRSLDEIDSFLMSAKPFGTADFVLVSQRGRVISASMDPALKTKPIEATPIADVLLPMYQSRDASPVRDVTAADGRRFLYNAVKIPTGDWTLVMRVARSELEAPVWDALRGVVIISVVGLALCLGSLVWLAGSVARPVGIAATVASRVAEGDLTADVEASGTDETGTLLRATQAMIRSLNSLVGQVKSSSIQVISTATRIAAAARSQESSVNEFSSSATEIAAAVSEISATSQELVRTMNDVSSRVTQTAQLATSGQSSLEGMESTMHSLADATSSISSKLAAISEKAQTITTVVTTITKVADQTNLLSLNAAIEAANAGEYGQGFAVVAQEIRRLADQTAVATLDIDHMVSEMQAAVSGGVVEMGRFTQQVNQGVHAVQRVSAQLGQIIDEVQHLTPRIEAVSEGMHAQATGASQISAAMTGLTEVARMTSASVAESNQAAGGLHDAVRGLREEVARFTVAEPRPPAPGGNPS